MGVRYPQYLRAEMGGEGARGVVVSGSFRLDSKITSLLKCLRRYITVLRGAHSLAVLSVLSRALRSVRLVLHSSRRFDQAG